MTKRKKRACLPRGLIISHDHDLPLLRLISVSTILSRRQIHRLAPHVEISEDPKNLNRRLRRLVENRLIVAGKPVPGFAGTTYSISNAGLLHLENNGETSVAISSNTDILNVPSQTIHFLVLADLRLRWCDPANDPQPLNFNTDRQIKAANSYSRRYAKDYDFTLEIPAYCGVLGGEYERYIKSKESYSRVSKALDQEKQLGAVLYYANSREHAAELLDRIRTKSFPVAAVAVSDFLRCNGSVYYVKVLCQASLDGPIWECDLHTFLNYSENVHRLHTEANEWNRWFKDYRNGSVTPA
jgi:hypothetical protein